MKKVQNIVLGVVSLLAFAVMIAPAAPAAAAECKVSVVGTVDAINVANGRFITNADKTKVSANVVVSGDADCKQTVTIVSWEAPNGVFNMDNLKNQKIHSYTTKTFGVGTHTITTGMKDCFYQIDLLNSNRPTAANGSPVYQPADRLMGWAQGGTKSCVDPTPVTPVTPTPKPVQPTPTVLPNTGAGDVVGIFAAVVVAGAALHAVVTKKRNARI